MASNETRASLPEDSPLERKKKKVFLPTGHDMLSIKRNPKKVVIFLLILALIVVAGWLVKKYVFKNKPKEVYDVAVMVREQKSSDPKEDARSSLKIGDVLLAKKSGHQWSRTEKISYLILKMDLTPEQFQKLTEPVTKKLTKDEKAKEMEQFKQGRENIPEEEIKRFKEELAQRRETVVMRKYRIKMEKYFPDFKPNDLIKGQPFDGEVFDWKIVEKKK